MKVTLSKRAYFEICDALSFLSRVSLEASQKLYEEIYSKLNSLKDFPFAYPIISNELLSALEIRKMNVSNGIYGVLYSARNDEIYVYRFLDLRKKNNINEDDFKKL